MDNLTDQIKILEESITKQLPLETQQAFATSILDLKKRMIEHNSIKTGDKMPDFILKDSNGNEVNSKDVLKNGKMLLTFFRGSWCPYCNLELQYLQKHLQLLHEKKVTVVAVSPQKAEHSQSLAAQHNLSFTVVNDVNNKLAKQLGIRFSLQDFVESHYKELGIDLHHFNGNDENTLPVPAVYVVNSDGIISYSFIDADYTNRFDIQQLLKTL
ncbi:peroxiredoxin-like family protein [Paenimyroides ceti]